MKTLRCFGFVVQNYYIKISVGFHLLSCIFQRYFMICVVLGAMSRTLVFLTFRMACFREKAGEKLFHRSRFPFILLYCVTAQLAPDSRTT